MENEFEIVSYPQIKYLNIFMSRFGYRNPHLHRESELILLLDGEIEVKLKQKSHRRKAPSLFMLNANEIHEASSHGESGAVLLVFQLSPMFFASIYPPISNIAFDCTVPESALSKDDFGSIVSMLVDLGLHYFEKGNLYEFYCASVLHMLSFKFIGLLPYHVLTDDEKRAKSQKAGRLSKILDYVDENFTHKVFLSDIADREKLSLSYLSHLFKENLQQSFQDYVRDLRFNQAKKLLISNKDMSLLDVCFQCGFSDYRYLQKVFADRLGCTPAEYRSGSGAGQSANQYESMSKASPSGSLENFMPTDEALKYLTDWKSKNIHEEWCRV